MEDYLTMAGHAGWNLSVSVISTGLMIILCALLIPQHGGEGAAWSVLIAFLVRGIGMNEVVKHLDGIHLLQWRQILTAVFVGLILVGAAYDYMGHFVAFILILLALGYGAAGARSTIRGGQNLIY
jgi:O-antigen/teichoic acid export membrane protein